MEEDRRVNKTKTALLNAYVFLAKGKKGKKVTVADLCREADVSRRTFYAHYLDMEDFLQKTDQRIIENLFVALNTYNYDTDTSQFEGLFFAYFLEQGDTIFTVLEREGGPTIQVVIDSFKQKLFPAWQRESKLPPEQLELLLACSVHGTFEFVRQWWKSGFQVDIETAKELHENISKYGAYNYIYTV